MEVSITTTTTKRNEIFPIQKNKKGAVIGKRQKVIIINMYKRAVAECSNLDSAEENKRFSSKTLASNISKSTGIGFRKVLEIISEYKRTGKITPPKRERTVNSTIFKKLDSMEKSAIRYIVHEFFRRNEIPTLNKLVDRLNEDQDLPSLKRSTSYRILKELGFTFIKRRRNSLIMDRDDIVYWRRQYLRTMQKYRKEGRPIYYLDETWVNEGITTTKVWNDTTVLSAKYAFLHTGLKNPSGKGKGVIIVHIGNEEGFVDNAGLIIESRKSCDFYDEMTYDLFETWFKDILPLLKPRSVIVLDNAKYHSRITNDIPNSKSKKEEIYEWLKLRNISVPASAVKAELLHLVQQNKSPVTYVVDQLAEDIGCSVLRLPPYHCELNPIELVWTQLKIYIAQNNKTFDFQELKKVMATGFKLITPEKWCSCISHVKQVEQDMWELDSIVENIVLNFEDESDDSDFDEYEFDA